MTWCLDNLTHIIDHNPMCILKRPTEKRHCFLWMLRAVDVTELAEILTCIHHRIYPIVKCCITYSITSTFAISLQQNPGSRLSSRLPHYNILIHNPTYSNIYLFLIENHKKKNMSNIFSKYFRWEREVSFGTKMNYL